MLVNELDIYPPTNRIANMMLAHVKNVSKEVKFAEYQEMRLMANKALDLLFCANSETDADKSAEIINEYLLLMFGIQHRLRRLTENQYLPRKFSNRMMTELASCQKQAIAWKKYFQRKSRNQGAKAN